MISRLLYSVGIRELVENLQGLNSAVKSPRKRLRGVEEKRETETVLVEFKLK